MAGVRCAFLHKYVNVFTIEYSKSIRILSHPLFAL